MNINLDQVTDHLRSHDISPSYPRKRILEYLIQNHTHPSVNDIYEDLIEEIPSLSKTTVYNTLRLFIEHKMVEEIVVDDVEKRYDLFNPESHGHFRCKNCGKVYDIRLNFDNQSIPDLANFKIHHQSFNFSGICSQCKKQ